MDHESDKIERLEDRIDQLEAVTKKMMPSRRDALKLGGAAAIGAAAMSGTASAGSNQVGTIGDANNLVDIEAEDVTINDTLNGASISGAAQDEALLSDGAGGLTFAEAGGGVPPNFSYTDQTSNRSLNTQFTNNTGKALYVVVTYTPPLNGDVDRFGVRVELPVGGVNDFFMTDYNLIIGADFSENVKTSVSFFVPDGDYYEVSTIFGNEEIESWFEAEM